MIIFDLEWNHGYKPRLPDEILQIGAVKVDRLGGRIIDTFNAYIHPVVYKKLYHKAKERRTRTCISPRPWIFPPPIGPFTTGAARTPSLPGGGPRTCPPWPRARSIITCPSSR